MLLVTGKQFPHLSSPDILWKSHKSHPVKPGGHDLPRAVPDILFTSLSSVAPVATSTTPEVLPMENWPVGIKLKVKLLPSSSIAWTVSTDVPIS